MVVPYRFSVARYDELIRLGAIKEDEPVELIRGEIVNLMPVGRSHMACVKRLNRLLSRLVGDRAVVSVQDPIVFPDSQPQPDVALQHPSADCYETARPTPAETYLIIEVADSSLVDDRQIKGPLYAENGIPDYWIVNLIDQSIEVYRQPQPDGTWGDTRVAQRGDTIDLLALPGITVAVADILH